MFGKSLSCLRETTPKNGVFRPFAFLFAPCLLENRGFWGKAWVAKYGGFWRAPLPPVPCFQAALKQGSKIKSEILCIFGVFSGLAEFGPSCQVMPGKELTGGSGLSSFLRAQKESENTGNFFETKSFKHDKSLARVISKFVKLVEFLTLKNQAKKRDFRVF